MPGIARIGDKYDDDDTQAQGSGDVFVNNIPVARLGDLTTGHYVPGHGIYPAVPVVEGSGSVFANNLPVARLGDKHAIHCDPPTEHPPPPDCHDGAFNTASTDVFADS